MRLCRASRDRGYLGLLRVEPQRQGTGLGRKLMDAAENFSARLAASPSTFVSSVRARPFLLLSHLGYLETGTAPFAPDVPAKVPWHYILMSKTIR